MLTALLAELAMLENNKPMLGTWKDKHKANVIYRPKEREEYKVHSICPREGTKVMHRQLLNLLG
jgi:hypothetical protein